jgi:hypothetical protein
VRSDWPTVTEQNGPDRAPLARLRAQRRAGRLVTVVSGFLAM